MMRVVYRPSTGFSNFNNSACTRLLNLLERGYLRLRELLQLRELQ